MGRSKKAKVEESTAKSLLENLRAQAADLEEDIEKARENPGTNASSLSSLNRALSKVYVEISKLTGEGNITEAMILKSPAFQRVLAAFQAALSPHPAAARALVECLDRLSGAAK